MLSSREGKAIRFHESGAQNGACIARVRGIRLTDSDELVSVDIVDSHASDGDYREWIRSGQALMNIASRAVEVKG